MDFKLNDDRRMLRDTLEKFLNDKYPIEKRLEIAASDEGYSADMWQQFAELGIIGALFDEANGGYGGQGDDLMVVFEQLGRALVVEPFISCAVLSGTILSQTKGNDDLIEKIIAGVTQIALAHGEQGSRYDLAHVISKAEQSGDDWLINANKSVVLGAPFADKYIVSARTSGAPEDEMASVCFLLMP